MIATYVLNIASSLALSLSSSPLGESAVDKARRIQLDGLRSHDFHLLLAMTAIVAAGVIMEGPEIVHEARDAWLLCMRRKLRHRRIAPWITLVGALGWLLIAVGVAGEGYWEAKVSHDDEAITSFDEQKLGEAEVSAAEANKLAGQLGVKVDALPTFVKKEEAELTSNITNFQEYARKVSGQTDDDLKRLEEDTQALNKARDQAIAAAKEAEAQREAMAADNRPRYLTPQQQTDLVNVMKRSGKFNAQIVVFPSATPDTGPLADMFDVLIKAAAWNTKTMRPFSGWAKGVLVCPGPTPKPDVSAAASAIVLSLDRAGIASAVTNKCDPKGQLSGAGEQVGNADMIIYIGSKF